MKLTHIRIKRLGPFYFEHEMPIDSRVTIITGSNDAGKSSSIRMLKLFLDGSNANEMDVNQDYLQASQTKWMEDSTPQVELRFSVDRRDVDGRWANNYSEGDAAAVTKAMAVTGSAYVFKAQTRTHGETDWKMSLPHCVLASNEYNIRENIDLTALNPLEAALMEVGFGAPFNFDSLNALSPTNYSRRLRDAQDRINKQMERSLPTPASLRFDFLQIEGNRKIIAVLLRDRHDAMTPFGLRGTGVRKMVTLLAQLLTASNNAHHRIVLLDEPENSLHPDAQHLLREFLFDLTATTKTQVIYATHSPCMINPMRPEQVRLLQRTTIDGKPTSSVSRQATDTNFLALRTSLGISASDSMLFAPVTVIVEGDTEFKCLALLLKKVADAGIPGFDKAARLLSLSHFLDGMGDSFEFLCRLAKSQGTRVVLFLDGDKQKVLQQQKFQETHPDVPIILLPNKDEFEQLVPSEIYFDALAEELGDKGRGAEFKAECEAWVAADEKRARRAFSKKVWGWVEEKFEDATATKQTVMRKAVELTPPDKINSQPLRDLLAAINKHLQETSF